MQRALADTRQARDEARQSQQETASALATVASQKKDVEGSLSTAEAAERANKSANARQPLEAAE